MDRDFHLIREMKNGDTAAMEQFVRQYYPLIRQYCQIHVLDRGYAEDLTQETFERFFRSLSEFHYTGKTLNYLYVIAGNLCKNFYKKKKETPVNVSQENLPNSGPSLYSVEDRLDLEKAMEQLPDEFREVVILYYFQGLKLKEIAEILDIRLPLAGYRLAKARKLLRVLLSEEEHHE